MSVYAEIVPSVPCPSLPSLFYCNTSCVFFVLLLSTHLPPPSLRIPFLNTFLFYFAARQQARKTCRGYPNHFRIHAAIARVVGHDKETRPILEVRSQAHCRAPVRTVEWPPILAPGTCTAPLRLHRSDSPTTGLHCASPHVLFHESDPETEATPPTLQRLPRFSPSHCERGSATAATALARDHHEPPSVGSSKPTSYALTNALASDPPSLPLTALASQVYSA